MFKALPEFQSTHSHGVRPASLCRVLHTESVSIHALTRSATPVRRPPPVRTASFQSTHSHGVRPVGAVRVGDIVTVSIHALTRSATISREVVDEFILVSIHALTRSATAPTLTPSPARLPRSKSANLKFSLPKTGQKHNSNCSIPYAAWGANLPGICWELQVRTFCLILPNSICLKKGNKQERKQAEI